MFRVRVTYRCPHRGSLLNGAIFANVGATDVLIERSALWVTMVHSVAILAQSLVPCATSLPFVLWLIAMALSTAEQIAQLQAQLAALQAKLSEEGNEAKEAKPAEESVEEGKEAAVEKKVHFGAVDIRLQGLGHPSHLIAKPAEDELQPKDKPEYYRGGPLNTGRPTLPVSYVPFAADPATPLPKRNRVEPPASSSDATKDADVLIDDVQQCAGASSSNTAGATKDTDVLIEGEPRWQPNWSGAGWSDGSESCGWAEATRWDDGTTEATWWDRAAPAAKAETPWWERPEAQGVEVVKDEQRALMHRPST